MYQLIAKKKVRDGFEHLSQARFDQVLKAFGEDVRFTFAGRHALSGAFERRGDVLRWFERMGRIFPGLRIVPNRIVVSGPPWNMFVTTQFTVTATLGDGTRYENHGMQLLRIRLGRIVEDHLIEDNGALQDALKRVAALGVEEAGAGPLTGAAS